ncbi:hypothetical protein BJX76DRAFT_142620 [Aspergillus varians]
MDPITRENFQAAIRSVVIQRSTRYTDSYSLSVHWELDDTSAVNDTDNFQSILQTLQLPPAQELVISSTDITPGWTVRGVFQEVLNAAQGTYRRALVIVHYAGHGIENANGELQFVERRTRGSKAFDADRYLISLVTVEDCLQNYNVDVLFILDCCFGFAACRAAEVSPRIVEFIAATDSSNPLAMSPPRNTVTNKLLGEIRRRQRDGHNHVEIADVVESLRSREAAIKKPTHCLKMGATSICLPFSGPVTVDPTHIPPALRAVFSVHLEDTMSQDEENQFVDWLRSLPPRVSITLEGIYPTRSTCLILTSAWGVWSKLAGMKGFKLIAEITGLNTISHRQSPVISSPVKKRECPVS